VDVDVDRVAGEDCDIGHLFFFFGGLARERERHRPSLVPTLCGRACRLPGRHARDGKKQRNMEMVIAHGAYPIAEDVARVRVLVIAGITLEFGRR
jgi:hypothetical protein